MTTTLSVEINRSLIYKLTKWLDIYCPQLITFMQCFTIFETHLISTDVKQPTGSIIWPCCKCISIGEILKWIKQNKIEWPKKTQRFCTIKTSKIHCVKLKWRKQLETYCYCIDIRFMSSKCLFTHAVLYAPQLKYQKRHITASYNTDQTTLISFSTILLRRELMHFWVVLKYFL